nr:hypothetical protein [Tanacetum cinerariifolium]
FEEYDLKHQMAMLSIKLESDADSEGEVVYADDVIPAVVSISTGPIAAAAAVFVSTGPVVAVAADSPLNIYSCYLSFVL